MAAGPRRTGRITAGRWSPGRWSPGCWPPGRCSPGRCSPGRVPVRWSLVLTFALGLALLWPVGPAQALAECSLRLDGLTATATLGTPLRFDLVFTNGGGVAVDKFRIRLSVKLPGLSPALLRVERFGGDGSRTGLSPSGGGADSAKVDDDGFRDLSVAPGGSLTGRYTMTWLDGTPAGGAVVSAEVQSRPAGSGTIFTYSPDYLVRVAGPAGGGTAGTAAAIVPSGTPGPGASTLAGDAPGASAGTAGRAAGGDAVAASAGPPGRTTSLSGSRWTGSSRTTRRIAIWVTVAVLVWLSWFVWRRFNRIARDPANRVGQRPGGSGGSADRAGQRPGGSDSSSGSGSSPKPGGPARP